MAEELPTYVQALFVMYWIVNVWIGAYVAFQKGRHQFEGMALAFLMGPLGIIVVACLPDEGRSTKTWSADSSPTQEDKRSHLRARRMIDHQNHDELPEPQGKK